MTLVAYSSLWIGCKDKISTWRTNQQHRDRMLVFLFRINCLLKFIIRRPWNSDFSSIHDGSKIWEVLSHFNVKSWYNGFEIRESSGHFTSFSRTWSRTLREGAKKNISETQVC
jgi:hypothetical protein